MRERALMQLAKAAPPENWMDHVLRARCRIIYGSHNDTTPRYNKAAARLAWQRTINHFNKTLKP